MLSFHAIFSLYVPTRSLTHALGTVPMDCISLVDSLFTQRVAMQTKQERATKTLMALTAAGGAAQKGGPLDFSGGISEHQQQIEEDGRPLQFIDTQLQKCRYALNDTMLCMMNAAIFDVPTPPLFSFYARALLPLIVDMPDVWSAYVKLLLSVQTSPELEELLSNEMTDLNNKVFQEGPNNGPLSLERESRDMFAGYLKSVRNEVSSRPYVKPV